MGREQVEWRKSSHSGGDSNCVEVRRGLRHVRDSKHPAAHLAVNLTALLADVRAGRLDATTAS